MRKVWDYFWLIAAALAIIIGGAIYINARANCDDGKLVRGAAFGYECIHETP